MEVRGRGCGVSRARTVLVLLCVAAVALQMVAAQSCPANTTAEACDSQHVCVSGACKHKPLFPMNWQDILVTCLVVFGCTISVISGTGGGGLFVPLLMLINGFAADHAVPLSKAMIFAASLWSVYKEVKKKVRGKLAIDYDASVMLQPLCICGTTIGVFANIVLPDWLIVLLLALVLGWTTWKALEKAIQVFRKDSKAKQARLLLTTSSPKPSEGQPLLSAADENNVIVLPARVFSMDGRPEPGQEDKDVADPPMNPTREEAARYQQYLGVLEADKHLPWGKVAILLGMWGFLTAASIAKRFAVTLCSPEFWVVAFCPLPVAIVLTLVWGRRMRRIYQLKTEVGHHFLTTDFIWNKKHTMLFPLISMVGGIAAGMVGIGGGMVLGPLLLVMSTESDPEITSAISTLVLIFTSSSTSIQFVLLHKLDYDYAAWLMFFAVVSSLIAKQFIKPIIDKSGQRSLILFSLAFVTGISGVLSVVKGLIDIIGGHSARTTFDFARLCEDPNAA